MNDLSRCSQKRYDEPDESGSSSSNTENIKSQTLLCTPKKSIKRAYPERCSNEKFTSSKWRRGEKHRLNLKDANESSDHKELASSSRLPESTPRKRGLKEKTKAEALEDKLDQRLEA